MSSWLVATALATPQSAMEFSVLRSRLFTQTSSFVSGCLTTSPPVSVMVDLRPMHAWGHSGTERRITDGRFDFTLSTP